MTSGSYPDEPDKIAPLPTARICGIGTQYVFCEECSRRQETPSFTDEKLVAKCDCTVLNPLLLHVESMTHLPASETVFLLRQRQLTCALSLSAAAACISTATSRGVLGPLSGDDSCKPLVQFKGWLECKTVLNQIKSTANPIQNDHTYTTCCAR